MAVNITWKSPPAGTTVTSVDHGSGGNGSTLTAVEVGVSHDGSNPITNCKFYIGQKSGVYSGGFSAVADLAELLSWGDASVAADFGGFQINMNQVASYPTANWPTETTKQPSYGSAVYTGVGDSAANGILLKTTMDSTMTMDGIIPASVEAKFKCRIHIPTNAINPGIRQFDQKLRYTYTS